jgi:hypothetical protein
MDLPQIFLREDVRSVVGISQAVEDKALAFVPAPSAHTPRLLSVSINGFPVYNRDYTTKLFTAIRVPCFRFPAKGGFPRGKLNFQKKPRCKLALGRKR